MKVIKSVVTFDQLYVGMQVEIVGGRRKPPRAEITRLHVVKTEQFPLDKFPKNSRPGGCDFADRDGHVHSSLRTYSVDGEPLIVGCRAGNCIHVRYRNNVSTVVPLWSVRPINPLTQLAEQA